MHYITISIFICLYHTSHVLMQMDNSESNIDTFIDKLLDSEKFTELTDKVADDVVAKMKKVNLDETDYRSKTKKRKKGFPLKEKKAKKHGHKILKEEIKINARDVIGNSDLFKRNDLALNFKDLLLRLNKVKDSHKNDNIKKVQISQESVESKETKITITKQNQKKSKSKKSENSLINEGSVSAPNDNDSVEKSVSKSEESTGVVDDVDDRTTKTNLENDLTYEETNKVLSEPKDSVNRGNVFKNNGLYIDWNKKSFDEKREPNHSEEVRREGKNLYVYKSSPDYEEFHNMLKETTNENSRNVPQSNLN